MAEAAVREELSRSTRSVDQPQRKCPACKAVYPLDFLVCPIDTTALEICGVSGDDPLIGEVLAGSFCVVRVLGAGGMGRVYEAQHVRLPRRFAVKVMHDTLARQTDAMARFEREAQAAGRIVNEHVLEVVDVVRTKDRRPAIVTELLEGEELGELLQRSPKVALPLAITITRQVCRGLAAAHAEGVVHRDLKPSNLFLVKREGGTHVKILDFGVAKLTDSDLTRSGIVVGTPAFMAPEQARGSATVDARADVYAVGAVLYRMLTGRPPFPEEDQARTLVRLLTEDPVRPRSIDRSIPEGVEALIQRAMARAPKDRVATAQEFDRLLMTFDGPGLAETARLSISPASGKDGSEGAAFERISMEVTGKMALEETRRARNTRPGAIGLMFVAMAAHGAATMVAGAVGLRIFGGRARIAGNDLLLLAAAAGVVGLFVFVDATWTLIQRWRSLPSIERLRNGLASSLRWLFGLFGLLALGWFGAAAFAPPPPARWAGPIELGVVVAPALFALIALKVGVRRASRVS
jgi:tRNA A-37 threonylcarbamoyl transferase component Bud32